MLLVDRAPPTSAWRTCPARDERLELCCQEAILERWHRLAGRRDGRVGRQIPTLVDDRAVEGGRQDGDKRGIAIVAGDAKECPVPGRFGVVAFGVRNVRA